jgi:hypothetical protein
MISKIFKNPKNCQKKKKKKKKKKENITIYLKSGDLKGGQCI